MKTSSLAVGGLTSAPTGVFSRPNLAFREQLNAFRTLMEERDIGRVLSNRELSVVLATHSLVLWQGEETLIPAGHPGEAYVRHNYGTSDLSLIKAHAEDPSALFGIPILECADSAGHVLKSVRFETRVFHPDCPVEVQARTMVVIPELALIRVPRCAAHADNPAMAMQHANPDRGIYERNCFLKAREALETSEALSAFDTLFRHYSINEELDRLDSWMKVLPFTLEEHPRMKHYEELLERQIGHLRKGAANWYEKGSSSAGVTLETYIRGICPYANLMPIRLHWLVEKCRQLGYKRVAEYGSVEGMSLFHLIMQAPDIEWHGFEINPNNVRIGRELAEQAELSDKFHLHVMGSNPHECAEKPTHFDAVALFEALEHNTEADGAVLLAKTEALVEPGGTVFITTPHGNWSAWDEHTRDLELRKDHIRAMTVKRMRAFLEKYARMVPGTLQVEKVENPSLNENNAWCFGQYQISP